MNIKQCISVIIVTAVINSGLVLPVGVARGEPISHQTINDEVSVISFAPFDEPGFLDKNVPPGTRLEDLGLPDKLTGATKDDVVTIENIQWVCDKTYNENISDTYTFTAQLPPGFKTEGFTLQSKIFLSHQKSFNQLKQNQQPSLKIGSAAQLMSFSQNYNNGEYRKSLNIGIDLPIFIEIENNIDLSSYKNANGGKGFLPIGNDLYKFFGVFEGNYFSINNMTINNGDYSGLIGFASSDVTEIKNIGIVDCMINGKAYSGGVAGYLEKGAIVENCYSTGFVAGEVYSGGIAGFATDSAQINTSFSTADVSGNSRCGGITGALDKGGVVSDCYSTGNVWAFDEASYAGGIAGSEANGSSILHCYSTGLISGVKYCGGIAGYVSSSSVKNCFALNLCILGEEEFGRVCGSGNNMELSLNHAYTKTVDKNGTEINENPAYESKNGASVELSDINDKYSWMLIYYSSSIWRIRDGIAPALYKTDTSELIPNQPDKFPEHITNKIYAFNGAGKSFEPFLIYSLNELFLMSSLVNNNAVFGGDKYSYAYYELQADVNMQTLQFTNKKTGFIPIGTENSPFRGSFDGNHKEISNLYVNSGGSYAGFFGNANSCVIQNLQITSCNIAGEEYIAAIAGYLGSASYMNNCSAEGNVKGKNFTGLLAGRAENSEIYRSYTQGNAYGKDYAGGLCGEIRNVKLFDCYSLADVTGDNYAGGITGRIIQNSEVDSVYSTGSVSALTDFAGGIVGFNEDSTIGGGVALNPLITSGVGEYVGRIGGASGNGSLLNNKGFTGIWRTALGDIKWDNKGERDYDGEDIQYSEIQNSAAFSHFDGIKWTVSPGKLPVLKNMAGLQNDAIPPHINEEGEAFEGEGIEETPYIIKNEEELRRFSNLVNNGNIKYSGAVYKQEKDINLFYEHIPIGLGSPFKGVFDGNGQKITGLKINSTEENTGLFGEVSGNGVTKGVIRNVVIIDCEIKGRINTGGIVGKTDKAAVLNCFVSGSVSGVTATGGIAGFSGESKIEGCFSKGSVTGATETGGISGVLFSGQIKNCSSQMKVSGGGGTGAKRTGGIAGYGVYVNSLCQISNCLSTGEVSGWENAGGILGEASDFNIEIINCVVIGAGISGNSGLGRILGGAVVCSLKDNYGFIYTKQNNIYFASDSNETLKIGRHGEDISVEMIESGSFWNGVLNKSGLWKVSDNALPALCYAGTSNYLGGSGAQNLQLELYLLAAKEYNKEISFILKKGYEVIEDVYASTENQVITLNVEGISNIEDYGNAIWGLYYEGSYETPALSGMEKSKVVINIPAGFSGDILLNYKIVSGTGFIAKSYKLTVVVSQQPGENPDDGGKPDIGADDCPDTLVELSKGSGISGTIKINFKFIRNPYIEDLSQLEYTICNEESIKESAWSFADGEIIDNVLAKPGQYLYLRRAARRNKISSGILITQEHIKGPLTNEPQPPDTEISLHKNANEVKFIFNNNPTREDMSSLQYTVSTPTGLNSAVWLNVTKENYTLSSPKAGQNVYLRFKAQGGLPPSKPAAAYISVDNIIPEKVNVVTKWSITSGEKQNTVRLSLTLPKENVGKQVEYGIGTLLSEPPQNKYYPLKSLETDNIPVNPYDVIYVRLGDTHLLPASYPVSLGMVTPESLRTEDSEGALQQFSVKTEATGVKGKTLINFITVPLGTEYKIAPEPSTKGLDKGWVAAPDIIKSPKNKTKTVMAKRGDSIWVRTKAVKNAKTASVAKKADDVRLVPAPPDKGLIKFDRGDKANEINVTIQSVLELKDFEFASLPLGVQLNTTNFINCEIYKNSKYGDKTFTLQNIKGMDKLYLRFAGKTLSDGSFIAASAAYSFAIPVANVGNAETMQINVTSTIPKDTKGAVSGKTKLNFPYMPDAGSYEYKIGTSAYEGSIKKGWKKYPENRYAMSTEVIVSCKPGDKVFVRRKATKAEPASIPANGAPVVFKPKALDKKSVRFVQGDIRQTVNVILADNLAGYVTLDDFEFYIGASSTKANEITDWKQCSENAAYNYGCLSFYAEATPKSKIFIRYKGFMHEGEIYLPSDAYSVLIPEKLI